MVNLDIIRNFIDITPTSYREDGSVKTTYLSLWENSDKSDDPIFFGTQIAENTSNNQPSLNNTATTTTAITTTNNNNDNNDTTINNSISDTNNSGENDSNSNNNNTNLVTPIRPRNVQFSEQSSIRITNMITNNIPLFNDDNNDNNNNTLNIGRITDNKDNDTTKISKHQSPN